METYYYIAIDIYTEKTGGNMRRYYYKSGNVYNLKLGALNQAKKYKKQKLAMNTATKIFNFLHTGEYIEVSVYDNNAKKVETLKNVD